jgi:anti-sigma factor RsiW
MTDRNSPVTEDELHVYVDGELAADRRQAVEEWLASHPDDAALVATWRAQAEAIRARYGSVIDEPIPARLALERIARGRRSWAAIAAAAAVVAFVVGGAAGWMARGASAAAPSRSELFTADAVEAHRLYITEVRHPIEVTANEDHLLPWLSRRVGTNLRAPDLTGFGLKMLGGRLLPGPNGAAALFMYEGANGDRFTFYCSRLPLPQTAFRYKLGDQVASVQWVESGMGYEMSGPADRDRLTKVAQAAYEQMENRSAPQRNSGLLMAQPMSRRGS